MQYYYYLFFMIGFMKLAWQLFEHIIVLILSKKKILFCLLDIPWYTQTDKLLKWGKRQHGKAEESMRETANAFRGWTCLKEHRSEDKDKSKWETEQKQEVSGEIKPTQHKSRSLTHFKKLNAAHPNSRLRHKTLKIYQINVCVCV